MSRATWLVALLLVSTGAFSQEGSRTVKEPSATAVARLSLEAMGGAALKAYQDSIAYGTVSIYAATGQRTAHTVIKSKGYHMLRIDLRGEKGTQSYAGDGAWACLTHSNGSQQMLDLQNLRTQRIDYVPAFSLFAEHATENMNVQYGGTAVVNGQVADVIGLSFALDRLPEIGLRSIARSDGLKLTQHVFYVDRASHFVTKMQYTYFPGSQVADGIKTEVYFSDYKLVDGIAVPFATSTFMDGKLVFKRNLTSIVFNTGVPVSDFDTSCAEPSNDK